MQVSSKTALFISRKSKVKGRKQKEGGKFIYHLLSIIYAAGLFFSVPLKRRADKIESRKNDASAQGARSEAPDGTGGFRGITIAVSAILLALKKQSLNRAKLFTTHHVFDYKKKFIYHLSSIHLCRRQDIHYSLFIIHSPLQQDDFLLSWLYQLVSTCEQPPKIYRIASGAISFLCGCEPEND